METGIQWIKKGKEKGKDMRGERIKQGPHLVSFICNKKELGIYFESYDEPLKCFKHRYIKL